MGTGQVITNSGLKIAINRTFKAIPDYLVPSKFKVGTGTTTPTTSDTDVETVKTINGGNTKSFVTGYPVLDEANFQAIIRCLLTTTDANGSNLAEFGLFNEDSSPLMFSHMVFTAITKTTSVQVSIVEKDRYS